NNNKTEAEVRGPVQSVSTATIFSDAQDKSAAQPAASVPMASEGAVFKGVPAQKTVAAFTAPVYGAVSMAAADPQLLIQSTAAAAQVKKTPSVSAQTARWSYFNPKSDRDPTMTPADYQAIRENERQKLENERKYQLNMRKQRYDDGEGRIKLQGIVGNSVIINGEMYSVGDTVMGVKILKIGSNYLIGEHNGKKFKKILK
ncbi:MAG: hypothetical protein WCK75_11490, partial [Elusimicrobiota bacterium]